jgi:hypothetical protein
VWEHSASKNTPRLVLLAIADKASGSDVSAYAGTTFLMRRANASRTAVIKAVDTLLESGELEIVEGKKGPHGETRYRIPGAKGHRRKGGTESVPVQNPDRSGKKTPGGTDSAPGGSTFRTPRGTESEPHNAVNTDTPVRTQKRGEAVSRRTQHAPEDYGPTPIEVDGFQLTDSMRRWAHATYPALDVDHSTAQFVSHYRSTGARRKSWPDAWQKWIRDDAQRAAQRGYAARPGNVIALPGQPARRMSTTDQRVQQALDVAAELRALEEGNTA